MHQNAPNPISISIFSRTPATGAVPHTPGEGGDAREGRERGEEGKGMGEVCVIAVGVIDAPGVR